MRARFDAEGNLMTEPEPCCPDWQRGIEAIDGCIALAYIHGSGYDRPPFRFCPWCGAKKEGR